MVEKTRIERVGLGGSGCSNCRKIGRLAYEF
jgi:hypothetical protein